MDRGQAAAIAVPALVAVAGFIAAYLNNLRLARRNDRLSRVNKQLSELYGPLLALEAASSRSFDAFRSQNRPDVGSYWHSDNPPTRKEADAWRLWMTEVFMPLNIRMEELIITKADLLESSDMPVCLLELVAHVESYKAVQAQWNLGDFSENTAPLEFPGAALHEYAVATFRAS